MKPISGLSEYESRAKPAFHPTLIKRTTARLKKILTNITIEPAVFLISFSTNMDDVSLSQMTLYKSCENDFPQYNHTTCLNLVQNFEANRVVQQEVNIKIKDPWEFWISKSQIA